MAKATRLDQAITEYLSVLKVKGSPSTIPNVRSTLMNFMTINGNIYGKSIRAHHVERWLLDNDHWEASTRGVNVARLSGFFKWMDRRGYATRSEELLDDYRTTKAVRKPKAFVPVERFGEVLDLAEPRDRIIIALGLFLLVRTSELTPITWRKVQDRVEVFRTKTQQFDSLPINPDLEEEIARWRLHLCQNLGVIAPDPDWYVACVMNRAGDRGEDGRFILTSSRRAYHPTRRLRVPLLRVKGVLAKAGIEGKGVGMHTLRRSGAQAMLDYLMDSGVGADRAFDTVRDMLGHASVKQTMTYLDWQANRKKRDELVSGMRLLGNNKGGEVIEMVRR